MQTHRSSFTRVDDSLNAFKRTVVILHNLYLKTKLAIILIGIVKTTGSYHLFFGLLAGALAHDALLQSCFHARASLLASRDSIHRPQYDQGLGWHLPTHGYLLYENLSFDLLVIDSYLLTGFRHLQKQL